MEAGLGTLSRLATDQVDAVLVVVEATEKSLEVARRALEMARDRNIEHIIVLANRIRDDLQLELVKQHLAGEEMIVVPYDPAIEDADRHGRAPVDAASDAPGVKIFAKIVEKLLTIHPEPSGK